MEIYEIDKAVGIQLPWKKTYVIPIGDVQLGSNGVNLNLLKKNINWGIENNAYFLGMGDYVDFLSPSNRDRLKAALLYDTSQDVIENAAEQLVEQFVQLMKGTEGRWLGLLGGHHFYEFRDGTTSDTRITQKLKSNFLGTTAFVRLIFTRENGGSKQKIVIWCTHGSGGGIKASAPLNKLENLVHYFDADIYLVAHMTKKVAAPLDQLYMTDRRPYKIKHRTKIIAGTGGYLQGYQMGSKVGGVPRGSYVESRMLPPVSLGSIILKMTPVHSNADDRIDLTVEL